VRRISGGWTEKLVLFQVEALPRFAVEERDHNDCALGFVDVACSDRDLVEEYLACGVGPLGRGWAVDLVDRPILSPVFAIELGDRSRDTFVAETEKEAEEIVGPISEQEIEKAVERKRRPWACEPCV
jgi:hypothetical protein